MNAIKKSIAGLLSLMSISVLGATGCSIDSSLDASDADSDGQNEPGTEAEGLIIKGICSTDLFKDVKIAGQAVPNPSPALKYDYNTEIAYYSDTASRGFDVTNVCLQRVNELRKGTNSGWPQYVSKASTSSSSKIGCAVAYEAKLAMRASGGHANAGFGWSSQASAGSWLVKAGQPHAAFYKAADTYEAVRELVENIYNEATKGGQAGSGAHAQAMRQPIARRIQCGMWQEKNETRLVVDYWNK